MISFQRSDTPKWNLLNGDQPSAIKSVHQIYNTQSNSVAANKIVLLLSNATSLESNRVGYIEAYRRNETFMRANWVNFMIMTFTVLT